MWRATVLTIFPELFPGPLGASLAGRAVEKGLWSLEAIDIRDFAADVHRSVDDMPAGGPAPYCTNMRSAKARLFPVKAAAGEGAKFDRQR